LKSTDDESFDQCVSCSSVKMTRKSFPHHPERATDLLGIIHTNVYSPLRHVSRQGACEAGYAKPPIGRPPKKRKKSNDEIASQSALSCKLSRKGNPVNYDKYGNVGHNRKGCKGQGGGFSQAGARKVSGQAVGATNVSGEDAGARKVSGQVVGSRKVSGQAVDARKASSQPSAA
nr:transposase, mutator type [Tanacetum cinerariifolium]